MIFIYSADLHGTKIQYEKLFEIAKKTNISTIIIGGDLAPKNPEDRTIEGQKKFYTDFLGPLCKKYSSINLYVIMGNDDFKDNMNVLEGLADNLIVLSDAIKIEDNCVIGYPYVPFTPFKYKDWDKKDVADIDERDTRDFLAEGVRSENGKLVSFKHNLDEKTDTIENDMLKLANGCKGKSAIWVVHGPPYDTALDAIGTGAHVGSVGIKRVIEKFQPKITLHGHIHETVKQSGKFVEKIGSTYCFTPGNFPHTKDVWYLVVDTDNVENTRRENY